MTKQRNRKSGMSTFFIIWGGQVVSIIGTGLTGFALGVYVYQITGSVTQLGLVLLANSLPGIIFAPIAGVVVDRSDRRKVMLLSDAGAGLATLAIWMLLTSGNLEIWHIYISSAVGSFFGVFQGPAYMASVTLLVPKEHYGRTSGLIQLGQAISQILAPILAGFLILTIKIEGVILIDFATFLFAVLTLLFVRIPRPPISDEAESSQGSFLREAMVGLRYVIERQGLLGMLLLFAFVNFSLGFFNALFTPLVLSFTTVEVLGTIASVSGIGLLAGSLLMSVWGGSKRKINSLLGSIFFAGVALSIGPLRPNALLMAVSGFLFLFFVPIANASSNAIWQTKVEPGVQGRVFAARRMLASFATPLAYLTAGPLADNFFEPFMSSDSGIAVQLGMMIGQGPGRGIALLFIIMGMLISFATVIAYLHPRIRRVELELPDVIDETQETFLDSESDK